MGVWECLHPGWGGGVRGVGIRHVCIMYVYVVSEDVGCWP